MLAFHNNSHCQQAARVRLPLSVSLHRSVMCFGTPANYTVGTCLVHSVVGTYYNVLTSMAHAAKGVQMSMAMSNSLSDFGYVSPQNH